MSGICEIKPIASYVNYLRAQQKIKWALKSDLYYYYHHGKCIFINHPICREHGAKS